MKLKMVCLSFWAAFLIGYLPAHSADAPYNFQTVDITIPGRPDAVVWLKDINSKGQILASTFWTDAQGPVWGSLIGKLNARQNKLSQVEIFFTCTGESINDARQVAGNSADGPCVRQPNGQVITLAGFPQAFAFGISTNGRISGTYCVPNGPPNFGCTGHGFTWHPIEDYRTIDLAAPVGTQIRTTPLASNKYGQVLIDYYIQNEFNETSEHGYCIWDGACGAPIALSFEWRGGSYFFARDFNDDGQAAFLFRPQGGPARLQLYDEGFLEVTGWPTGWLLQSPEGMSNDGAFVGAYFVQTGVDPFNQSPILKRHDFIATPVKAAKR